MRWQRVLAVFSLLACLYAGLPATAQEGGVTDTKPAPPAVLVADKLFITPDRKLVAEGNVRVLQGETRLTASRITYDQAGASLSIDGPIRIEQGDRITILASSGELNRDLQNGLLRGARLIMDDHVQMATLQMTRVNGRYNQLYKTAVTSCHVCNGREPLWQIRAKRIVHDQLEKQLYFEEAQLRFLGVPILYMPHMRLPDPSLKRANGFLTPSIRTTSQLSTGFRIPYFVTIGDHADLTFTPYLSSRTRTLGLRYRQAFRTGRMEFEGAYTRDDLVPDKTRGYLFGAGQFDLPRRMKLSFSIQHASDNAYLVDYGLPDLDRLQSEVALTRVQREAAFRASLITYQSLRDSENESELPTVVADARYERRFFPALIGGELRLNLDAHAHYRSSNDDKVGRDIAHTTAQIGWQRDWVIANRFRAVGRLGIGADFFNVHQDSDYPEHASRVTPDAAVRLSYPMVKTAASGVTQFLEPVVQLAWADVHGDPTPNDESGFVEFDEGNLLELSRFPAYDRREDGVVLAFGVNWTRDAPGGARASFSVGQILRDQADPDFSQSSGLSGTRSDLMLAGQLATGDNLTLTARTLLDTDFSLTKAEFRGAWNGRRVDIAGTYLWLNADDKIPDDEEDRPQDVSEFWFDGAWRVNNNWTASAMWRYDIADDAATRAGLGLIYNNECVEVGLSLNRRLTSSTSVEPTTDFGFNIALRGFTVKGKDKEYRRSCSSS